MTTLLFFPNDHLLMWVPRAEDAPSGPRASLELAARVERGAWPFPADWRVRLEERFYLPERLALHARAHGYLVVIYPECPLVERGPLGPGASLSAPLTQDQRQVLQLLSTGLTTQQIAVSLHRRRRWVFYQVATIKRKCGAITRADNLKKKGE